LGDDGDLLDPLPKRPPGMHHRTYQRLCDEIDAATDVAFFGGLEASANGPDGETDRRWNSEVLPNPNPGDAE